VIPVRALIERALNWFEQIDRSQHFDSVSISTRLALRSLLEFCGSKATQPMLSRPLIWRSNAPSH
jgi:hypothetical protein